MAIIYNNPGNVISPSSGIVPWDPPELRIWLRTAELAPKWLLKDLIPWDSNVVMSGPPKTGHKSWLAFLFTLVIASGRSVGLIQTAFPEGLPVLVLEGEGPQAEAAMKWQNLAKSHGFDLDSIPNIYFSHREGILLDDVASNKARIAQIKDFIVRKNIRFVIVDTLKQHMDGDENSAQDVGRVMRTINYIRQTGASVLYLHHLTKPSKDAKDIDSELRGSSAVAGNYDSHLGLRLSDINAPYCSKLFVRSKMAKDLEFDVFWTMNDIMAELELQLKSEDQKRHEHVETLEEVLNSGVPISKRRIQEILQLDKAGAELVINNMLDKKTMVQDGAFYKGI